MRMGTSTNILFGRPDGTRVTLAHTLTMAAEAGFSNFDLNFYDWSLPGSPFLTEGWREWIEEAAETAKNLEVSFGQCHAYFYNFLDPSLSDAERERHLLLQRRSLECSRLLGAHTCVLHPETASNAMNQRAASLDANIRYYEGVLDWPETRGMRIALENMCDFGIAPRRKFGAYPEELAELVDALRSDRIGVCWDFEHGDIMDLDQPAALRFLGRRLFATHVSDTYSKTDNRLMHVLPMTSGTIDWPSMMRTLKEIGYQGEFCYEAHNYLNRLPDEVIPTAMKLAFQIGVYLMKIWEDA